MNDDTLRPSDAGTERLDLLREAFAGLTVPEATPELADTDPATRQVVETLQRAWADLPVPAARPPRASTSEIERPARRGRILPLVRHAVAAVVVLGLGLAVRHGGPTLTPGRGAPPIAPETPRLVAAADDHIEFRSGAVRLVLVTRATPRPDTD